MNVPLRAWRLQIQCCKEQLLVLSISTWKRIVIEVTQLQSNVVLSKTLFTKTNGMAFIFTLMTMKRLLDLLRKVILHLILMQELINLKSSKQAVLFHNQLIIPLIRFQSGNFLCNQVFLWVETATFVFIFLSILILSLKRLWSQAYFYLKAYRMC
jgi:hypothetical protein